MSQNPNDERPVDAVEQTDPTERLAATHPAEPEGRDTQVLDAAAPEAGDTQVLPPAPAHPDEPLSVFDQPSAESTAGTAAYTAASYGAPAFDAASTATPGPSTGTASSGTPAAAEPPYAGPSYDAPSYTAPSYTAPSYTAPVYEAPAWTPPPAPLVRTTPRTGTIVWGFVILAIGVGTLSVAAGASLDVGLAMIYLLAAAGAVLVVASVVGAARRRSRTEPAGNA